MTTDPRSQRPWITRTALLAVGPTELWLDLRDETRIPPSTAEHLVLRNQQLRTVARKHCSEYIFPNLPFQTRKFLKPHNTTEPPPYYSAPRSLKIWEKNNL